VYEHVPVGWAPYTQAMGTTRGGGYGALDGLAAARRTRHFFREFNILNGRAFFSMTIRNRERPLEAQRACGRCPLLTCLSELDNPGPCLRMAWADTDNPVY